MSQSRTPAGVPTGGEFASNQHDEAPALAVSEERVERRYEWDGEAMTAEDALQDWIDNNEIAWDDLGFDSEEEAHEAVFAGTRWDAPAAANLDALHEAARYHGIPDEKLGLPTLAVDAYEFDGTVVTGVELYSRLLSRGDISPAAEGMTMRDVVHQYNESNALEPGDDDYVTTIYDMKEADES